jgi:hypothetical protein
LWEDFALNFGDKRTGCCITTHRLTLHFPPGTSDNWIEEQTERPLFLHKWGDRGRIAGSAEHPHRTRLPCCILKKWQKRWDRCNVRKGTTSRVMVASRPKARFWPDVSTSPGNYGWPLLFLPSSSLVVFSRPSGPRSRSTTSHKIW